MKNLKITLDLKSAFVGAAFSILLVASFAFQNPEMYDTGRFKAISSQHGFLVLDSDKGEFMINQGGFSNWTKVDFRSTPMSTDKKSK